MKIPTMKEIKEELGSMMPEQDGYRGTIESKCEKLEVAIILE
jgi:hypothetical protein